MTVEDRMEAMENLFAETAKAITMLAENQTRMVAVEEKILSLQERMEVRHREEQEEHLKIWEAINRLA